MTTGMWWFLGVAVAQLVAAAVLLRVRSQDRPELPPQALALLRGGPRAAVVVALVALHQRGAVAAGRRGTIRANGGAGSTRDPLQLGVHRSLQRALTLRLLATRPKARQALDALRAELGRAGLLRPPGRLRTARALLVCVPPTVAAGLVATGVSGPALALGAVPVLAAGALLGVPPTTRAARRLLDALRARHPLPARRQEVTEAREVLLYVALYGDPALTLFLPHFSRDGGLLGHRAHREDGYATGRGRNPENGFTCPGATPD
ncbi:TIGR04222 domain-containing membrane protein [Streptomyces roseicoloratus]|uniref:TIGR04222 domain-containing membrane protein n=1 Tax=Streptomyces roseicoloratus TaxID=2508722 RepID=A0ABY9RQ39_9ACTN|nr:TIGR04222 domain-containing membrane protein [Streptomyces roseicoloratus]WMX44317.1 TIGR04222 domain-containing membrane protein [Streptomyces roseicoloratus]